MFVEAVYEASDLDSDPSFWVMVHMILNNQDRSGFDEFIQGLKFGGGVFPPEAIIPVSLFSAP